MNTLRHFYFILTADTTTSFSTFLLAIRYLSESTQGSSFRFLNITGRISVTDLDFGIHLFGTFFGIDHFSPQPFPMSRTRVTFCIPREYYPDQGYIHDSLRITVPWLWRGSCSNFQTGTHKTHVSHSPKPGVLSPDQLNLKTGRVRHVDHARFISSLLYYQFAG